MKRVLPCVALLPLISAACAASTPSDGATAGVSASALDPVFPGAVIGSPFGGTAFLTNWDQPGSPSDNTKCHLCSTTPNTDPTSQATAPLSSGTLGEYAGSIAAWSPTGGLPATYGLAAGAGDAQLADRTSLYNNVDGELHTIADNIGKVCQLVGVGCTITPETTTSTTWARAFPKVQGRSLVVADVPGSDGFDHREIYPDPRALGEQRSRGAKTYCAMRQAAEAQSTAPFDPYTLEDNPGKSFALWNLGKTGAKVKLLPPQKFTADPESEAFVVPIAFSGSPSPIAGPAMPNFGDLSHRIEWITGDREIYSAEDYGIVHDGVCFTTPLGPVCRRFTYDAYRQIARNLEHVDVVAGEQTTGGVHIDGIPIWMFPPFFNLTLGGDITVESGVVEDSGALAQGRVRIPAFDGLDPRPTTFDDVLSGFSLAADAPLAMNGTSLFIVAGGKSSIKFAAAGYAPFTRWENDDDRAVSIVDHVHEGLHMDAKFGLTFGPINVSLDATSALNLDMRQEVVMREQLSLVDGHDAAPRSSGVNMPQTNVLITPASDFTAVVDPLSLDLKFTLDFDLDLIAGTVHIHVEWKVPLYTFPPVPLPGDPLVAGDENHRLRVGEYTDVGATSFDGLHDAPSVYSHLPGTSLPFASFPTAGSPLAGSNVQACLADPASPPSPPAPTDPPPPEAPPVGAFCAIGPGLAGGNGPPAPPSDLCTNPDSAAAWAQSVADGWFANSSDPAWLAVQKPLEVACMSAVTSYLCGPVTMPLSGNLLSHVQSTLADAAQWGNIELQCTKAFSMGATDGAGATALSNLVAASLMPIKACSPDGTPTP